MPKVPHTCNVCGGEFLAYVCDKRTYCSMSCRNQGIGAAISSAMRGKKISKEAREKMSKAHRGLHAGAKHPNWKGGEARWKRFADPAYRAWRDAVLERDDYTCQDCGRRCAKHERGLAAHHLRSYADHPDLRLVVDNGITLCRRCHMKRHRREPKPVEQVLCACGCGTLIDSRDRFGHPRKYALHHFRRSNSRTELDWSHPRVVTTPEMRDEVVRLYETGGVSQRTLAKRFGVSQPTIMRIIHAAGIAHKP